MKIYLAGPLFSTAECDFNFALATHLRRLDYDVFLPQEHQPIGAESIFASDMCGLCDCDVVVAIWDGSDPDSGTAWECGWAYGVGVPVIGVRTDFRQVGDHGDVPVNLMLACSAKTFINASGASAFVLSYKIHEALQQ